MNAEQQKMNEVYRDLLSRSATEAEFRELLLTNPREGLAEFYGPEATIPEDLNVRFIENEADATFVLPDPVDVEATLSVEELEAVAGGGDPAWWNTIDIAAEAIEEAAQAIRTVGCDTCYFS